MDGDSCRQFKCGDRVSIMNHWGREYGTVVRENYDNVIRDEDGEYVEHDMVDVMWERSFFHRSDSTGIVHARHLKSVTEEEWTLRKVMDS